MPIAGQRPRIGKVGAFSRMYDPQSLFKKQLHLLLEPRPTEPFEGAISVSFEFRVKIPKSWSKKKKLRMELQPCPIKPDLSNYIKFIEDALNGILWLDDAQIVAYKEPTCKLYSQDPMTIITIYDA